MSEKSLDEMALMDALRARAKKAERDALRDMTLRAHPRFSPHWRCTACGAWLGDADGDGLAAWRWTGEAFQHTHADSAQAGHFDAEHMTVEKLRAIIDGRTTPPTPEEMKAHKAAGGQWLVRWPWRDGSGWGSDIVSATRARDEAMPDAVWIALDSTRKPCAWPVP